MNLAAVIDSHPGEATALVHGGRRVSYADLRQRAGTFRAALLGAGVVPGDRVGIVLGATPAFVVAYLAVLGAGAVAVPLNPGSPTAELSSQLATVRAAALLLGETAPATHRSLAEGEYATLYVAEGGEVAGGSLAAGVTPPGVCDRSGEPAVLLFTSGTAGAPKAAVLTHANLLASIEQMSAALRMSVDDVGLLVVPPFHIYGLNAVLGVHLAAGAPLVLRERFEPASLLEAVMTEGVTLLAGVPALYGALASHAGAKGTELSSLRLAISGAAPLPLEVAERFRTRFGMPLLQGYGLTEASPGVTFPAAGAPYNASSVGVPLPGVEVRLVDADGGEVETGDPGEILVKGDNVFAGYLDDPAATKAVLDDDGWLHTGDVGVMDARGSLTIVDRRKDLVIVSGFNVFPAEVERVLETHPAVATAAVVGVPDAGSGEAVRAFVVPRAEVWAAGAAAPEGISEAELIDFACSRLARYKCPSSVVFVRELPRGLDGAVLRRSLA